MGSHQHGDPPAGLWVVGPGGPFSILASVISLDPIRRALATHDPVILQGGGSRGAAVALVLRQSREDLAVLFIERARREGDPWSGHMAFPGGRVDPGDANAHSAAERETLEEVGIHLDAAERIGRLDDMQGHRVAGVPSLLVSAFVYYVKDPAELVANHEVQDAFWFPVSSLLDPERHVEYPAPWSGEEPLPGIRVGIPDGQVVWGLTYRFLEVFLQIIGSPLPGRWKPR